LRPRPILFFEMTLSSHSAPAANAGFGYQFERALYWLAQSPAGYRVGIETADDVAVRSPDASQVLEQDKHSVREDGEPFGNRSKDLWNTLAIWIDALDSKQVSADATTFLMVTNKTLQQDCIAHQISRAKSKKEIEDCIAALEKAAKNPPRHITALTEHVLRPASRPVLRNIILKCELVDGAQTAGKELRKETIARLQLPEWCLPHSDSIANELSGWVHNLALEAWRQRKPAWIHRDYFVNQLHAIIERRKRQISRERAEHLIPVTDDKVGQEKARPFVKQLHLVTDDDTLVDTSIREFIRCNIEKIRLSSQGDVTDDDWKAFETALLSRWEKIRARVMRMTKSDKDEDVGFEIFTDTTENHREKLAGSDTEQVYLTSGTYHRLADMIRVGWHPRFKELMRELKKTP
jgi:hypothetical protein